MGLLLNKFILNVLIFEILSLYRVICYSIRTLFVERCCLLGMDCSCLTLKKTTALHICRLNYLLAPKIFT